MILSALLSLFVTSQDVLNPRDQRIVRAFVTAARTGIDGEVLPPIPAAGQEPDLKETYNRPEDVQRGYLCYDFARTWVTLDIVRGRVDHYNDFVPTGPGREADGSLAPRRVTDAQAIAQARRFYAAAGWPGGFDVYPRLVEDGTLADVLDNQGDNESGLQIDFVPTWNGVRYEESRSMGQFHVHRQTGQLTGFSSPGRNLPPPPASLAPAGSLSAARNIAFGLGAQRFGEAVAESPGRPFGLRIWYPVEGYADRRPVARRSYSARVRSSVEAGRGVLAYVGWLSGGSWECNVGVVLDALSGEVIEVVPAHAPGGSGGAGGTNPRPLIVPTAPRPWRVGTGKGGWKAWTSPVTAALTPAPKPPAKGAKILLTDGRAAFPATYDAKANLLGISGKGYRPGEGLAKLLRKWAQTKSR